MNPLLQQHCDQLRALHRPGDPLLLANAWDVATARATVAAGFPVVATTSGGVAATLGYDDQENAPAEEMFAAAARIARGVDVPVTVDAEAGYGLQPSELVAKLQQLGAAGCNLEDTDYTAAGSLRTAQEQADWLAAVRKAATDAGYPLVINARIDLFLGPFLSGAGPEQLAELLPAAIERAHAYLAAGADCVYPILLWEQDSLRRFAAAVDGPVNVLRLPLTPPPDELAAMGIARVSWGTLLHGDAMTRFQDELSTLTGDLKPS
ncbi:isocitrate lyase/phosphoenolpyruvate mutase family protein [Kribbella sp. NPDC051770]|uniref:isocitrate lyase/PEP mutase family protein n=1 Tax=Kribbella sp. NPDC051770 TaxID=3155413 RepID=UPI00343F60A1